VLINMCVFDMASRRIACVVCGLQQDCEYDSVELRSGFDDGATGDDDEGSGKVHGTFCGSTLPQPITSDGNKLRITFSTDNTVQKTGFSAVFFTGTPILSRKTNTRLLLSDAVWPILVTE